MFNFPRAGRKDTWEGQGALMGPIPYLGLGALGLCFGMSCFWIRKGAPYHCREMLQENVGEITSLQAMLHEDIDVAEMYVDLALMKPGERELPKRSFAAKYKSGTASHLILDLLNDRTNRKYIIWFNHTSQGRHGTGGHAIAAWIGDDQIVLMDPNYGVGLYASRSLLVHDLHDLMAVYAMPGGEITRSGYFAYDVDDDIDAFGGFSGATSSSSSAAASSSVSSATASAAAAASAVAPPPTAAASYPSATATATPAPAYPSATAKK